MPKRKDTLRFTKVTLEGFKSIEKLDVEFEKGLNILIGKNASGKSNFLEFLFDAMNYNTDERIPYLAAQLEFTYSSNAKFRWETSRRNFTPHVDLSHKEKIFVNEKLYLEEKLIFQNNEKNQIIDITFREKRIKIGSGPITKIFQRMGIEHFYPTLIGFSLPFELACLEIPGTIKIPNNENGVYNWNLPYSIQLIDSLFFDIEVSEDYDDIKKITSINKRQFLTHLEFNDSIKSKLKKHSPIKDIRFSESINIYRDDKRITIENLKVEFKLNTNWIPWSYLSDGTKRLFYLISEISSMENGIALVEEPELGIHPHQFHQIMEFLKEEANEKQIIISTHSPQALNCLNENELSNILLTTYDDKKGTQIKHLTKAQQSKAKKYMNEVGFLSDYWMHSDLEQ
ncbi:MAG: AAA family ATPase [Bacteroidia bacterium]